MKRMAQGVEGRDALLSKLIEAANARLTFEPAWI
jgi:hypothetical protein